MIRIFSKNKQELNSDIDVWIVEWTTYIDSGLRVDFPCVKRCHQAFIDKDEANDFKDCLNEAMKLIGITSLPLATINLQKKHSL